MKEKDILTYNKLLPFGISTAGFILLINENTITTRAFNGPKIINDLDDGMGGHNDFSVVKSFSIYVHELFLKLGFLVAE
jgi:hypothetical protein